MAAAFSYAATSSVRPESSVPTPAENKEISREMANLGAKESADWQKLRAERRAAREQILSDLRNSSAAETKCQVHDRQRHQSLCPDQTRFQQYLLSF